MKVVIVGQGALSEQLVGALPNELELTRFSIRGLSKKDVKLAKVINECANSDLIIYLAYHHRDLLLNINVLLGILKKLKSKNWQGRFMFFNTQTVLADIILKGDFPLPAILRYDIYTITKKIQSKLLKYYSSNLKIYEIFIPVIIGPGSKAHERFKYISDHEIISMPMSGLNEFAFIYIDKFVAWAWEKLVMFDPNEIRVTKPEAIFVYQGVRTYSDMFLELRSGPVEIVDCVHKHRFDDNYKANFIWYLRLSPIGLLLSFMKNFIDKYKRTNKLGDVACNTRKDAVKNIFTPKGSEYQLYRMSIDLDAIPIKKVRIY